MKHLSTLLLICLLGLGACGHAPEVALEQSGLRFHMSFSNQNHNDLDIHVVEPSGKHLSLKLQPGQSESSFGIDCTCGDCSKGPSEYIYWYKNQAGKGLYEIWVQQFQHCGQEPLDSEFSLEVYEGDQLKATLQGTLGQGQSQVLYYEFGG